jgi:hypothetical protein
LLEEDDNNGLLTSDKLLPFRGVGQKHPNALGEVLTNLRIVPGGGHPWMANQMEERLRALGFEGIETLSPSPPVLVVLGQRPIVAK